jgi:hypothetical protein
MLGVIFMTKSKVHPERKTFSLFASQASPGDSILGATDRSK